MPLPPAPLALPLNCPPTAVAQTAVAAQKRRTAASSTTNELEKSAAQRRAHRRGWTAEEAEGRAEEAMSLRESRRRLQAMQWSLIRGGLETDYDEGMSHDS